MEVHEIWQEGLRLRESGDEATAREALEQACRLDRRADPDYVVETANPNLWLERGLIFLRQNEFNSCRDCLLRAVGGEPSLFEGWLNLGIVHLRLDDAEAALEYLIEARKLNSESARVHQWVSNALNLLGRHAEARSAADRCLEISPQSVFAVVMRAQALEKLELYDEAAGDYRRALEIAPGNHQVTALLLRSLQKAIANPSLPGRTVEQCQLFLELLPEKDGREVHARVYGGRAYRALGNLDEAEDWLQRAAWLGSDEARLDLARMHYQNGSLERALDALHFSQVGQFWSQVLGEVDPSNLEGDKAGLSEDELARLLSGEVLSLPEQPGWLRLRQELGGGRCRTALLSTDRGPRWEGILTQQYRNPVWPDLADPRRQDLKFDEGCVLYERINWDQIHQLPGDPNPPELPGVEESWKAFFQALQAAEPHSYPLSIPEPPRLKLDVAQECQRSQRLSGAGLEAAVCYWLARGGPAFTLDLLLNLERGYAWRHLRRLLAGVDDNVYSEAVEAATRLREKPLLPKERYFLSFCLPQENWIREDWELWLSGGQRIPQGWCLMAALPDPEMVGRALDSRLDSRMPGDYFQDLVVRHGLKATRPLLFLADAAPSETHARQVARALSLIDSEPVRTFFADKLDHPGLGELARDYLASTEQPPHSSLETVPGDPALERALQQATKGGELNPRQLSHLEVTELTLAGARVKSLTSLAGIGVCPELETLVVHACSPLSLAPLAELEQLQRLYLGPAPEDSEQGSLLWSLVEIEALEGLTQLVEVALPIQPALHPDFANFLRKVTIRGKTLDSSEARIVNYHKLDHGSFARALAQLNTAIEESLSPLFGNFGLGSEDIANLSLKLLTASVFFSNPAQAVKHQSMFSTQLQQSLAELQAAVEEGLEWDRDVWQSCELWIGEAYGEAFVTFLSENLPAIINFFMDRLEGKPLRPPESNWFARQVAFEKTLAALELEGSPVLDIEHGCLTWVKDGVPQGGCRATLLGTLDPEGQFVAGWCDPVANMVASASLGIPARARVSPEQAFEVARAIAAGTGVEVVQAHQNPGGILFLGLECLYRISEDACPNIHLASVNDGELYAVLMAVHDLLTQYRTPAALPQARETLGNLVQEMRRRNALYWHGTRAAEVYESLVRKLEPALELGHDRMWQEVRDALDQWRIQMEKWKPEPIHYQ